MPNDGVKRTIGIINRWNIEKIEAFYLFLRCYWKFWDMFYGDSDRYPYRETVMEQLELRGFDKSLLRNSKDCVKSTN